MQPEMSRGSGLVSRRGWLRSGLGAAGGIILGGMPARPATAGLPDVPSKQMPQTHCNHCYCPAYKVGWNGASFIYYCNHCNDYIGSSVLMSPIEIPSAYLFCGGNDFYCFPDGSHMPPSKQMPVAATGARTMTGPPLHYGHDEMDVPFKTTGIKKAQAPHGLDDRFFGVPGWFWVSERDFCWVDRAHGRIKVRFWTIWVADIDHPWNPPNAFRIGEQVRAVNPSRSSTVLTEDGHLLTIVPEGYTEVYSIIALKP
jgi:hypothetical protein